MSASTASAANTVDPWNSVWFRLEQRLVPGTNQY